MDQYLENDDIIQIGPFSFGDQTQWKDCQDLWVSTFQKVQWNFQLNKVKDKADMRMTKRQLSHFQAKYRNYRTNLSILKLNSERASTFFPQDLLQFLLTHRGKYQLQQLQQFDLSNNLSNQHQSQNDSFLFLDCRILCISDFCNLAVLKLKGNNITSLQIVITACNKFQSLLELDLQSNKITSLKPFNKCKLTQLQWLKMDINHLINLNFIERALMFNVQLLKTEYNQISNFMSIYKCKFPLLDTFSKRHNILPQNLDRRLNYQLLKNKFTKLQG